MKTYHIALVAALIAGGVLPDIALGTDNPKTLEERVADLEKKVEAPAEKRAGPDGFSLTSADGDSTLSFHAQIQADARFYTGEAASGQTDTFLLRRVRPILSGTLFRYYDFLITPDFGGGTTVLYDAYLEINAWPFAKLRAGKFKPPVGLERLQSDSTLVFAERGLPSDLLPQRDVGIELSGDVGGVFTYQTAFTNGAADGALGDVDTNDGKEVSGRIFTRLAGLGLGVAGTYTGDNTLLPTYKTGSGQQTFFSYSAGTVFDGEHTRWAPQANYYHGPVGIYGEYAWSSQVARLGSAKSRLTNRAWQAAASYVLTGENASYNGVVPRLVFDPRAGTWGALEVAARYDQLYIDPDTFTQALASASTSARKASAYTVGLNWYLTRAVKFVVDYENTWFSGGNGTGDRLPERVFLARWQLAF